ncbi:hypothetical protein T4B_1516 [Trichinella pseudospiralis]|uniref:Uncharacterized protein n=1 Tax=Trichinella pseudospiralis TaxID=6337 RepID=A0A0V1JPS8_TRIPS|nr:hypothetical protein T4E_11795 [Trichinella pseudospiralis]KRY71639.1 hypothetical protein T4A_9225 [Trichinella pseudospiralis]KRZ31233.1 hypothetical protein T4B_1516 [Trichinella pseudospiralis]KRZ36986.1 hypothetical protein T4C_12867 [Trichinella pseudospiralis]
MYSQYLSENIIDILMDLSVFLIFYFFRRKLLPGNGNKMVQFLFKFGTFVVLQTVIYVIYKEHHTPALLVLLELLYCFLEIRWYGRYFLLPYDDSEAEYNFDHLTPRRGQQPPRRRVLFSEDKHYGRRRSIVNPNVNDLPLKLLVRRALYSPKDDSSEEFLDKCEKKLQNYQRSA